MFYKVYSFYLRNYFKTHSSKRFCVKYLNQYKKWILILKNSSKRMKIEWKTVNLDSFQNISKSLTKLFLKKEK